MKQFQINTYVYKCYSSIMLIHSIDFQLCTFWGLEAKVQENIKLNFKISSNIRVNVCMCCRTFENKCNTVCTHTHYVQNQSNLLASKGNNEN